MDAQICSNTVYILSMHKISYARAQGMIHIDNDLFLEAEAYNVDTHFYKRKSLERKERKY